MRYIKTKEKAKSPLSDGATLDLRYRMRKGLKNRYKITGPMAEDQDSPQGYAEDTILEAEAYAENAAETHVSDAVRRRRDKHRAIRTNKQNSKLNKTTLGAADIAAPSFRMAEKAGIPTDNHMTTNGIPIGSHSPGNSLQAAYTRRAFIRQRQAEMFIQKSGAKSLSGHYSDKTWRNRMVDKTRESVRRTTKAAADGAKNLYALLAGGSVIPLVIVILICSIGLAVGSVFGIFFSGQNTGSGKTMQAMVQEMNEEYQDKISELKASVDYDYLALSGKSAVWREVLAVYAVRAASGSDAVDVASLDENRIAILKETFWAMHSFATNTETIKETIETEEKDAEGNTVVKTEEVEKTVLKIVVSHKTANDMAVEYGFDEDQLLSLEELLDEQNNALWAGVLYGIYDADDYLAASAAASRVGNFNVEVYMKGPMIWPLDSRYHTVTDSFGFRIHPIKKIGHNHTGTDIGAPEGANIYAVLSGTVTAAGDAGSYGYRVIIDHGDGVSTLYAHASRLLVSVGDTVEQGDVIALVGETGSATGPHLHIEVRISNVAQDAMNYLVIP